METNMPTRVWQQELLLARAHASEAIPDPDALLKTLPPGTKDTYRVLAALLAKHNHVHAVKRKTVSHKTMSDRGTFLYGFFRELRTLPRFRHIDPRQLRSCHVAAMVDQWVERGLGTGTIHIYLSYLRVFATWINKGGLVHPPEYYLGKDSKHAHRTQVATRDHSWEASGVDVDAKIAEVARMDFWVGLQLELALHFGLRGKEARHFRPSEAIRDREHARIDDAAEFPEANHFIRLRQGTKGGRVRDVPILDDAQLDLIRRVQAAVPNGGFVGRQWHTPKQARNRYNWILHRAGITKKELGIVAHGLRHRYANNLFEAKAGAPSPVRGAEEKSPADAGARQAVARALGHGRATATAYYIGAIQPTGKVSESSRGAEDPGVAKQLCLPGSD
jgi:integrase